MLLLGLAWQYWLADLYPYLLKPVAFPFFRLVGVEKWLLSRVSGQFISVMIFLALELASPRALTRLRRTSFNLVCGMVCIACGHLLLSWAVYEIEAAYPDSKTRGLLVEPLWILNTALPLGLWLLLHRHTLTDFVRSPRHGLQSTDSDRTP